MELKPAALAKREASQESLNRFWLELKLCHGVGFWRWRWRLNRFWLELKPSVHRADRTVFHRLNRFWLELKLRLTRAASADGGSLNRFWLELKPVSASNNSVTRAVLIASGWS